MSRKVVLFMSVTPIDVLQTVRGTVAVRRTVDCSTYRRLSSLRNAHATMLTEPADSVYGTLRRRLDSLRYFGPQTRQSTVLLPCSAFLKLLQKIQLLLKQMTSNLNNVSEVHVRFIAGVVRSPLRKTLAVGIAGLSKVHPKSRHRIGKLAVQFLQ